VAVKAEWNCIFKAILSTISLLDDVMNFDISTFEFFTHATPTCGCNVSLLFDFLIEAHYFPCGLTAYYKNSHSLSLCVLIKEWTSVFIDKLEETHGIAASHSESMTTKTNSLFFCQVFLSLDHILFFIYFNQLSKSLCR
jgi:hypothetical protein